MSKKSFLIQCAISFGWFPVTDHTKTFIQAPCPSCQIPMEHPPRTFLLRDKIFKCSCGYSKILKEKEYEDLIGRCFICGKENCKARDHRFHGKLIGMGF